MKEENKKKKLIKIKREQVINKSDIYFIINTIILVSSLAFFFLVIGGFSEVVYLQGGRAAIQLGWRVVILGSFLLFCGVMYIIIYEVRKGEQERRKEKSIYKSGATKFWRWLWSDIKRSKK